MPKKKKIDINDDELEEMIEENSDSSEELENVEEIVEESTETIEITEVIDDESNSDEVIEIDDDDLVFDIKDEFIEEDEDDEDDSIDIVKDEPDSDIVLSKHTIEGKHSLKYDSIFKGKKEENNENEDFDTMFFNERFEVDKASNYWFESIDNENYTKEKRVKEKVYEVLSSHTDINFLSNRRKPSRVDFNQYYYLLKTHLKKENFTNIELFNELSVYFSDNLFNMFKLLDNKWRNMIIIELQDHIGKKNYQNDVAARNIHKGTEIEFEWLDKTDNKLKMITGVVIEADYEVHEYKVDSYENIYDISIDDVKKILNNSKFKYNLNKLNNIDFL
jgi:hypothetical protein